MRVQDGHVQLDRSLRDSGSLRGGARRGQAILLTTLLLVVVIGGASAISTMVPGRSPAAIDPAQGNPAAGAIGSKEPAATQPVGLAATAAVEPEPTSAVAQSGPSAIVPGSVNRTSIRLEATYDVDLDLGFNDRSVRVDATVTLENQSGGGIDRVELNTIAGPLGNLRLLRVQVDGGDVAAKLKDQTIVVPLGGVLPESASTTIRVRFRATFRSSLGGSSWMFTRTDGILQANRLLPWVGLHRPFDRPNHGDPFFSALSPFIRVRITTDRSLVIVAPGRRTAVNGLTQTFEAENVRDFTIVASPHFSLRERQVGGVRLLAYVRPSFPTAKVLDQAADGLKQMSALAGAYPYDTFKIAQTAGGYALEGPGMIWIPTGMTGFQLRWNVYHETAHQWFYGIVGSDGAMQPFADESAATFLGQHVSDTWRSTGCKKRRLDLSIYRYSSSCYFGQIYVHGARTLRDVRRAMGSAAFWDGIRDYVADHRFRHRLDAIAARNPRCPYQQGPRKHRRALVPQHLLRPDPVAGPR